MRPIAVIALIAFVAVSVAPAPCAAQTIPVTTPRLPARPAAGATTPATAAYPATTGPNATDPPAAPAYGPVAPSYGYGAQSLPPQAAIVPQRAGAGHCRVQPTPDRQALMLVVGSGTEALPKLHVPLGEYRAQQVVHSADGRWAVASLKLRGAAQFAAMVIDLERCEPQRTIDLDAPAEDVRFDVDEAVFRIAGGEKRVAMRDGRVR